MEFCIHDLELIGAALYLGEGTKMRKTNKGYIYAIEFTNTDARMIVMFLKFLRKVIHPVEERIKAQLFIYDDIDKDSTLNYWSRITDIPFDRFQKTMVFGSKNGRFKPSKFRDN